MVAIFRPRLEASSYPQLIQNFGWRNAATEKKRITPDVFATSEGEIKTLDSEQLVFPPQDPTVNTRSVKNRPHKNLKLM